MEMGDEQFSVQHERATAVLVPVGKIEPEVRGSTPGQREQDLMSRVIGIEHINSKLAQDNYDLQQRLSRLLTIFSQYGDLYGFAMADVMEQLDNGTA